MNSHPNYIGYDALIGKGGVPTKRPIAPTLSSGTLKVSDFITPIEKRWIGPLNKVMNWCVKSGVKFSVSPHDYQLATITTDYCQIVLWSARDKRSKKRFIKPCFQGSIGHETKAKKLFISICELIP